MLRKILFLVFALVLGNQTAAKDFDYANDSDQATASPLRLQSGDRNLAEQLARWTRETFGLRETGNVLARWESSIGALRRSQELSDPALNDFFNLNLNIKESALRSNALRVAQTEMGMGELANATAPLLPKQIAARAEQLMQLRSQVLRSQLGSGSRQAFQNYGRLIRQEFLLNEINEKANELDLFIRNFEALRHEAKARLNKDLTEPFEVLTTRSRLSRLEANVTEVTAYTKEAYFRFAQRFTESRAFIEDRLPSVWIRYSRPEFKIDAQGNLEFKRQPILRDDVAVGDAAAGSVRLDDGPERSAISE